MRFHQISRSVRRFLLYASSALTVSILHRRLYAHEASTLYLLIDTQESI
jgi:hypothetical protein